QSAVAETCDRRDARRNTAPGHVAIGEHLSILADDRRRQLQSFRNAHSRIRWCEMHGSYSGMNDDDLRCARAVEDLTAAARLAGAHRKLKCARGLPDDEDARI